MAVKLFSYRRGNSVLHKVPALAKILFLVALCVIIFSEGRNFLKIAAGFAAASVLFGLAGFYWRTMKNLVFVIFLGAFVIVLRSFDVTGQGIIFSKNGLFSGITYTVRFFIAAWASQTVYETTSPLEIREALENVQDFLAKIFPPLKKSDFALAVSLAINFIPEIFETWERIRLASRSRSPKKKNILMAARIGLKELESLLSCMLHHAETKRMAVINRSCKD